MVDRLARRDVLAAGAGTLGSTFVGGVRSDPPPVTVATRNCYLGANLFRLLAAAATTEGETVRDAISALVTVVDRSRVERRLDAIAAELARTEPDLIGVQEASMIRTGPRSNATAPTATDVRYDFRESLLDALDARDLPYRVVTTTETTDIQLPASVDGERRDVRLTDRDLILARESVTTANPVTNRFDAAFSLTRDGRTVTVERAYGAVDATVGDRRLTFGNTHLESASSEVRADQAAELRAALEDRPNPVVLVGDLNSGPGGSTSVYAHLTETFEDVASDAGPTCCHEADLRNSNPSLDERIDHVLVRGDLQATDVTRVGADPAELITVDGERIWPSDHAGVVATLAPVSDAGTPTTAPATPTSGPPATSPTTGADSSTGAPGFSAAAAVVSVVAAALAARRRGD